MTNFEKEQEYLITKPTKDINNIFFSAFGGISFREMVVIFLVGIIGILFCGIWYFAVYNFLKIAGIILFIITILFFLCLIFYLVSPNKKSPGTKNWEALINRIKYLFSSTSKEIPREELALILGWDKFENNTLVHDDKSLMVFYELKGSQINLLTDQEKNNLINAMSAIWLRLDFNHKIVVVDENLDLSKNNEFLKNLKKMNTKDEEGLIEHQIANLEEINEDLENNHLFHKTYVLSFQINANDLETLERTMSQVNSYFRSANVSCERVMTQEKIANLFNKIFGLNTNEIFRKNGKTILNLEKLMPLKFYKDYFTDGTNFSSFVQIRQCPGIVYSGWMKDFTDQHNIQSIISVEKANQEFVIRQLQKSKIRIRVNFNYIKDESINIKQQDYLDKLDDFLIGLSKQYTKAFYVNITFVLNASSLEELKKQKIEFIKELKTNRFVVDALDYRQDKIYRLLFSRLISVRRNTFDYTEMANDSLAAMFPFISSGLNDSNGIRFATDIYSGEPFYMDPKFKDNEGKRNSNVFVVAGMTGSGKTFTVSKIINFLKLSKTKQFIIDPLGDYFGFSKNYYGVKVIDLDRADNGLINPLQVFHEGKSIEQHSQDIMEWFEIIDPKNPMTTIEKKILVEILVELYRKFKIDFKNPYRVANDKWPTTDNLYQLTKAKIEKNKDENSQKILARLWNVSESGAYGKTWNGHTTMNVANDDMIIFDTSKITDRNPILKNGQMYLLFNFLYLECLKNRDLNASLSPEKYSWISIVVDEAHRMIASENPIALNALAKLSREIRHHKGILILASQSIQDYLGEGEEIIKQALYHIILRLKSNDVEAYNSLLKISASSGLTSNEKNFIQSANNGECLFVLGDRERSYLKIEANEVESIMWEKGKK